MSTIKITLLMAAMFALFMAIGRAFGGSGGLVIGFALALVTNFASYWFSDKIALSMNGAREVSASEAPQLHNMVHGLAYRAGLPMPRVYVIDTPQPNAFATGRNPQNAAVAVTQGILRALPPDELEAVLAHEMAHIKHNDILISTVAATMAGAISMAVQLLRFGLLFGGYGRRDRDGENPLVMLGAMIVAPIAAAMIQMAISRAREFDADRGGAEICGRPLSLANALMRIEENARVMPMDANPALAHMYIINPLGGEALEGIATLFRTHPRTVDRIARLNAMAGM